MNNSTPHFLVGALAYDCSGKPLEYARRIGRALNSQVDCWQATDQDEKLDDLLLKAQTDCDLLFLSEPVQHNFLGRLLNRSVYRKILDTVPASLWLIRQPRWPINSILLIVRAEEGEEAAEEWALRLALACGAAVTVLVISPADPIMYREGGQVQAPLEILLTADSPISVQIRRVLRRLRDAGVKGSLQQRTGTPDEQIERELAVGNHDLVIIAAEKRTKLWRYWLGELVEPLLHWLDRPVLIVR